MSHQTSPSTLTPFGPDIWIAEGTPVVAAMGFHYPTRMAVIRLVDGGLFVWSPVALTPDLQEALAALGPVHALVAPNTLHHVFMSDWIAAYPEASVHGAPGLEAKRPEIAFTSLLDGPEPAEWSGQIDQALIPNKIADEVVFFHRASGTVLVTDLIQHLPVGWYRGWRALVARMDLMTAPEPSVPRKFRMALGRTAATRAALAPVLAWPTQSLVMAHGNPVTSDARGVLRRAFDWLG